MVTSRTGTAQYKAWRTRVLHRGQREGILNCPCNGNCSHHQGRRCNVVLDYTQGRRPNSAEPDHDTPWAQGGRNTLDNGKILCRRCNQSQGDKKQRKSQRRTKVKTITLNHSGW